jgi:hypothetical protein
MYEMGLVGVCREIKAKVLDECVGSMSRHWSPCCRVLRLKACFPVARGDVKVKVIRVY